MREAEFLLVDKSKKLKKKYYWLQHIYIVFIVVIPMWYPYPDNAFKVAAKAKILCFLKYRNFASVYRER